MLGSHCSYQDMDKSELSESLRLPKAEEDADTFKFSRDDFVDRTMKWEQEAFALIEAANGSALLKAVSRSQEAKQSFTMWDLFRLPEGARIDWSAPLEAVQQLSKWSVIEDNTSVTASAPSPLPNDSLAQILTSDQIEYLLDIFSERYAPWLNFTPIRDSNRETEASMLDLVECTIASRHLDESTRSAVAPRLQALAQDSCAKLIFQSRNLDSLEAIQCLLILSLWAPLCGASEESRDARMLIGSAVSIAMNCRLNEACDKVYKMHSEKTKGENIDEAAFAELMNKFRLWLAIANAESMLCIGSGRVALSKRDYEAYRAIFPAHPTLSLFPVDLNTGRDVRLRFLAELCDATETGLAIRFTSLAQADIDKWYDSHVHIFHNLSRIVRLNLPLALLSDHEKLHFKVFIVIIQFCRLLLLYHGMSSCRMYQHERNPTGSAEAWFRDVRPRGVVVAIAWSKEAFQLSEAVLVSLLEIDSSFLITAPDYLFTMVSFAAGFALGSNFLVLRGLGIQAPGSTVKIMERLVSHLMKVSVSPDSAARKCAKLVSVMIALYEARKKEILATPRPPGADQLGQYSPFKGLGLRTIIRNFDQLQQSSGPGSNSEPHSQPQSQLSSTSPSSLTTHTDSSPTAAGTIPSPTSTTASSPLSSGLSASTGGTRPSSTRPHPHSHSLHTDAVTPNHNSSLHPTSLYPQSESPYPHPESHSQNQNQGASIGVGGGLGQSGLLPPDTMNTDAGMSNANLDFGWFESSLVYSQDFWHDFMGDMNLSGHTGFGDGFVSGASGVGMGIYDPRYTGNDAQQQQRQNIR